MIEHFNNKVLSLDILFLEYIHNQNFKSQLDCT